VTRNRHKLSLDGLINEARKASLGVFESDDHHEALLIKVVTYDHIRLISAVVQAARIPDYQGKLFSRALPGIACLSTSGI
jgi:hypothetical protein